MAGEDHWMGRPVSYWVELAEQADKVLGEKSDEIIHSMYRMRIENTHLRGKLSFAKSRLQEALQAINELNL